MSFYDEKILSVTVSPFNLKYITKQTSELASYAVELNGLSLQFVHGSFHNYQLYSKAVKQNGFAIQYVKRKLLTSVEYNTLVNLAIENEPRSLMLIHDQTEELCKKVLYILPTMIVYSKYQTENACIAAIKYNPKLIHNVKNKTDKIIKIFLTRYPRLYSYVLPLNAEQYTIIVKAIPSLLKIVPFKLQTPTMCFYALRDKSMRQFARYGTNLPDVYYAWYRNTTDLKMFHDNMYDYWQRRIISDVKFSYVKK